MEDDELAESDRRLVLHDEAVVKSWWRDTCHGSELARVDGKYGCSRVDAHTTAFDRGHGAEVSAECRAADEHVVDLTRMVCSRRVESLVELGMGSKAFVSSHVLVALRNVLREVIS